MVYALMVDCGCCCLVVAALVNYLSPLLPLARFLRLPVLDFGVYKDRRDSQSCVDAYHSTVVDFFMSNRVRVSRDG